MRSNPRTTIRLLLRTFTHADRPDETAVASYHGPATLTVGLPNLRTVSVETQPSSITVFAVTEVRHGFRLFVVPGADRTRVVVDVAR